MNTKHTEKDNDKQDKAPTFLQVIGSVLSAFIGIQNKKNKERDFKYGNHRVFIIVGLMMTLTFLVTVITIVQVVLSQAK
ncbi:MAG: DUF2970 domain-containing protein [Spongiibacteraceae bacterium]